MRRRGFTLIELLLAASMASLLMLGILIAVGGTVRDAQRLRTPDSAGAEQSIMRMVQRDLAHATSVSRLENGQVLVGNAALDPHSGLPSGRLARITYRIERQGDLAFLVREQVYLDDPIRPTPWRDVMAVGATGLSIEAGRVHISFENGNR